jgi:oligoribonuclease (3'-5' exoribonuclease)
MEANARPLVWMDLEMTGLDPSTDLIVEIATLVTDAELNIVAEGPDLVIHVDDDALAKMGHVVTNMHAKSGLTEAIRASTVTLEDAGAQTLAFIKEHVPVERTAPLCGNSIGTDRRFLATHLPAIEEYLHYRSVDVSTVKERNSSTAGTRRSTPSAPTSPATTAPSATSSTPSTNSATTASPSSFRGRSPTTLVRRHGA